MFTTIGNLTHACAGDIQEIYFPGQRPIEIIDLIIGVIALVAGAIIFSQGYHVGGALLFSLAAFQSNILFGNIAALIKICRLSAR